MTSPSHDVEELLDRYAAAWNGHDLDAIMAEHTPDTVFQLHIGEPEAVGLAAVRAAFAATLEQWPDIHFEAQDVRLGADHAALRWTITMQQVRFDAVDVLVFDGGRIARKDTYVDSISLQEQLAVQPAAAGAS